ncbi:MAG: serine--tRNA ligase [Candidatus Wallbacteria bacterium]|nr:serine--tRNA ligase [Candidatus Wallbacteria bacterium]
MIDLKALRDNPEEFRRLLGRKRYDPAALDRLLELDAAHRELLVVAEEMRAKKNATSKQVPKAPPEQKAALIAEMKTLGDRLAETEAALKTREEELGAALVQIPNPPHESVPEGVQDADNQIVRTEGTKPVFDFPVKDHLDLAELHGTIDVPRAARLSGARFAYLTGELALLELALVQYAMHKLLARGFTPVVPPIMVRERAMYGTGFFPADKFEIFKIEGEDRYLVGTSEVPLAALHMEETLKEADLPRRYAGFSTCLRREAGTYGKDTRGIFRVHQFDKVEMFSFSTQEKSWEEHELLLSIEEEIARELGFHYRVVNICAGTLGAPAAKKYDLEVWLPGQNAYRELTSCSNCTDFQARRLNCRYKTEKGNRFVHTLNGTATAIGRTLIALLENHQQADGSVRIPQVLRPFLPGGLEAMTPAKRG